MSSPPPITSLPADGPPDADTQLTMDAQSVTTTTNAISDRPTLASTTSYWCHACEREGDALLDSGTLTCTICGSDFVEESDEVGFHHEAESDELGRVFGSLANLVPPLPDQPGQAVDIQSWMRELLRNSGTDVEIASEPRDINLDLFFERHPIGQDMLRQGFNLLRNIESYVMGQGGLDPIVTELMEQGSRDQQGAREEKISALPRVKVEQSMIEQNVDCTICQDDFVLEEELTRLPCEHYFHPPCIEPWLKINGSCPVCRFSLNAKTDDAAAGEAGQSSSVEVSADGSGGGFGSGVEDLD
ncbi:hypothetical protein BJ742DRAFT_780697 [Cladochytrium replicatum]|nr:hypothetical protein BJ742DRAFT_780697 [Cladochytrium replicatum]